MTGRILPFAKRTLEQEEHEQRMIREAIALEITLKEQLEIDASTKTRKAPWWKKLHAKLTRKEHT